MCRVVVVVPFGHILSVCVCVCVLEGPSRQEGQCDDPQPQTGQQSFFRINLERPGQFLYFAESKIIKQTSCFGSDGTFFLAQSCL